MFMEDTLYISNDGRVLLRLIGNYDDNTIYFKGEVIESSEYGISIGEIDTHWSKHQFKVYSDESNDIFPIY